MSSEPRRNCRRVSRSFRIGLRRGLRPGERADVFFLGVGLRRALALGERADVFFLGVGLRRALALGERADVLFLGVVAGA